jgi:tRNA A-37 threonylcarbamoyl transferase component Bud32
MNHLPWDRLVPEGSPPRTDDERTHLATCARCRAEARLLADHVARSDRAPGLDEARPAFQKLRRELSQSFVARPLDPASSDVIDLGGARWLRMSGMHVRDGAEEIARRVRTLGIPAILQWRLESGDVLSRWPRGARRMESREASSIDRPTVVRVVEDVAAALARLHEHGLTHGNVCAARVTVARGRGALLLSGLAPGSVAADEAAFQDLAREWLGVDLPPDLATARVALSDVATSEAFREVERGLDELAHGVPVEPYVVDDVIGRGGMAVVYRVRHGKLGTWHALKVLTRRDSALERRLLREGRTQGRLAHPNVVPVTDLLDVGGAPGLVLPFVEGPSLAALLRVHRPTEEDALALFAGILAGVAHAHRRAIVHRDLKPTNVLLAVSEEGVRPRVVDFGLAKATGVGSESVLTQQGSALGTPAYAAPEQMRDASSADQRADVWSLGCILYELLSGEQAFVAPSPLATLTMMESPPLAALAGVTERLAALVREMLSADPERRPSLDRIRTVIGRRETVVAEGPLVDAAMALVRRSRPTAALVGRSAERAALEDLLERDVALVTVVGTPGVGKTALVEDVVGARTECVWIRGASFADGDALAVRVQDALRSANAPLLVLDEIDHLEAALVERLPEWLESRGARFLVTSQAPLELRGEHSLLIQPLSESDARALYRAVAPDADDAAVEAAVAVSDGVPLALIGRAELPGADPALIGPWRTAMARAWGRLDPSQRSALVRLGDLGASFGLAEAESVLRSDCDEQIAALVARGFLRDTGDGRWRLLDTVSRYVGSLGTLPDST